jgi:hypothetical protein
VFAGCHAPEPALAASISTLTVMLETPLPIRQSECTPGAVLVPVLPRMFAPVRPCVVASLTTAPVLLKVSVTRMSTFPKPTIELNPW